VFFISCIHPIEFTDSFKLLREKILKGFGSQQTQGVAIAEVKLCLEDDATVQELLRKNQVVLETLDPQLAWLKLLSKPYQFMWSGTRAYHCDFLELIRKKVDEVISDVTTPEQQAKLDLLAALNDLKFLFYALDTIDNAKLIVKHLLGMICIQRFTLITLFLPVLLRIFLPCYCSCCFRLHCKFQCRRLDYEFSDLHFPCLIVQFCRN